MTFGAPRVGGGPVSHEAVLTMRQAHPKDTCQQLAERLGCSMSTIKRHLRREREQQSQAGGHADGPHRRAAGTDPARHLDRFRNRRAPSSFAGRSMRWSV